MPNEYAHSRSIVEMNTSVLMVLFLCCVQGPVICCEISPDAIEEMGMSDLFTEPADFFQAEPTTDRMTFTRPRGLGNIELLLAPRCLLIICLKSYAWVICARIFSLPAGTHYGDTFSGTQGDASPSYLTHTQASAVAALSSSWGPGLASHPFSLPSTAP
jgi:hypothetical protein